MVSTLLLLDWVGGIGILLSYMEGKALFDEYSCYRALRVLFWVRCRGCNGGRFDRLVCEIRILIVGWYY